jgi:hypothetical protein
MSRILLVSEDELTDLAHSSKLDILTRLDAVREANPEAAFEDIVEFVRAEALAATSGFDPYAQAETPVEEEPVEEPETEVDPEGVSLVDDTEIQGQLDVIEAEPEADEEPEPEVDNTPVAYNEFDATQHTEAEREEEPEAAPNYNTPVFPQELMEDDDAPRRTINRRILAREVAQIDRDEDDARR